MTAERLQQAKKEACWHMAPVRMMSPGRTLINKWQCMDCGEELVLVATAQDNRKERA